jgi:predicted metal-binding membrane protein
MLSTSRGGREIAMSAAVALDWMLRRDRAVVLVALTVAAVLAWAYLLVHAGMDMAMGDVAMPMPWTPGTFGVMFLMWTVMMVAMMLPSAAPMILLFTTINRRRAAEGGSYRATTLFALAYVAVWVGFSGAATAAQWGLDQARLLSTAMSTSSVLLAGLLFMAGGLYELTPLKQACLRQCQSPLEFLSQHWREGARGAIRMGLLHGLFCVGCCWAVMLLLFVGGLMNVLWIAAIAVFVLIEKTAPAGLLLGRIAGVCLILWGGAALISGLAGC